MSYDFEPTAIGQVVGTPFITVGPNANSGATYNGTNATASAAAAIPSIGGSIWLLTGTHGVTVPAGIVMAPYNQQTWFGSNGTIIQAQAAMTWGVFNNFTNTNGHTIQDFTIDENNYAAYGFYWSNGTETGKGALSYIEGIQVLAGNGQTNGMIANFSCFTNGNFNCQSGYEDVVWVACVAAGAAGCGLSFSIQVPGGEQTIIAPKCFSKPFCINCVGAVIIGSSIISLLVGTGNAAVCGSDANSNFETGIGTADTTNVIQQGANFGTGYCILGWGPTAEIINITATAQVGTSPAYSATFTRGQLGSVAVAHPAGEPLAQGTAIPLATLTTGYSAAATTIVTTTPNVAWTNAKLLQIDSEVVSITSGGGTDTLVIVRAQNGTVAAAHAANAICMEYVGTVTHGQATSGLVSQNALILINVQLSDSLNPAAYVGTGGGSGPAGSIPGSMFGIGSYSLAGPGGNGLPCVTIGVADQASGFLGTGASGGTWSECIFFPNSQSTATPSLFNILAMGFKYTAAHPNAAFGAGSARININGGLLRLKGTGTANPQITLFTFAAGVASTYNNGLVTTDGWRIELDAGYSGGSNPIVTDWANTAAVAPFTTVGAVTVIHRNQAIFTSGAVSAANFQFNSQNLPVISIASGTPFQNTTGQNVLIELLINVGTAAEATVVVIKGPTSGATTEYNQTFKYANIASTSAEPLTISLRAGAWCTVTVSGTGASLATGAGTQGWTAF